MVYAVSIVGIVVIAGLLHHDPVDIGHHHRGVHLHLAGSERLERVHLRIVVGTDPLQKLGKAYVSSAVRRGTAVVEVGHFAFAVDFLAHQKVLLVVHDAALPDLLAVLLHLHHRHELLQCGVRHVAQRQSKFQRASLAHLAGQRGVDELFGVGDVHRVVDAGFGHPRVNTGLCTGIDFVAHRLAPRYLMLMLQSADAEKTRVPTTPSGMVRPSMYCQSVDLARMPTSKPLRDTAMSAAVSLRWK